MQSSATNPEQYVQELPEDRQGAIQQLRKVIMGNLPKGFSEGMGYGMIGYSVPHSIYPAGYHCDPKIPLPFMSIASQKNFIAVYHMGLYADEKLMKWFVDEYAKASDKKLDMGKSCIRFKKPDQIPYELMGKLASKMTPEQWVAVYEKNFRR